MKELEIVKTIREIESEYKHYKDGGISLIERLADKVLNTVENEKKGVISFFLREIRYNKNNLWSLSLQTIVKMNLSDVGEQLEYIYQTERDLKKEDWRKAMIDAMLKMQHKSPSDIYFRYIEDMIKTKPGNGYFSLIYYSTIEPEKSISLLSDFYAKYLGVDTRMQNFVISRIDFLCQYILKNPTNFIPKLIRVTREKNGNAGVILKKILVKHLEGLKGNSKVSEVLMSINTE